VLVNPLDEVSMQRIVNVPPRGLGKTSVGKLREAAELAGMSLREAVAAPELHGGLGKKAQAGLRQLADVLDRAQAVAVSGPHAALKVVIEGTGYLQHATSFGDAEDSTREENIAELVSDTVQFAERAVGDEDGRVDLAAYLQHVALLTSADTQGEGPAVQMMTVHAAKGLEFDHVSIAGLEEGVFPSMRSAEDPDGLEEERRLMYVALTRGRKTVFLSSARERRIGPELQHTAPSRFLKELPRDCVQNYTASWQRYAADDRGADSSGWTVAADPEALAALRPGVRVRHDLYGSGVLRRVAGRGSNSRAVVRFDDGVEREFVLEYAGLKLLEDIQF